VDRAAEVSAFVGKLAAAGRPSYWVGYVLLVQAEIVRRPLGSSSGGLRSSSLATVGRDHTLTRKAVAIAGG
jgi:hypothetical protein